MNNSKYSVILDDTNINKTADWICHFNQLESVSVLRDIRIGDISVEKTHRYIEYQILADSPTNLASTFCFKESAFYKAPSVKDFSACTEKLLSNLHTKAYVKSRFKDFYDSEVHKPAMDIHSDERISIFHQAYNALDLDFILGEISKNVIILSQRLIEVASSTLLQQLQDLSFVNEIFAGLIFMPHILLQIGFTPFWSFIFPYFLAAEGNIQTFIIAVKDKVRLARNLIPRYLSWTSFAFKYKWPLISSAALSGFILYGWKTIVTLIEPLFNLTSDIVVVKSPSSWYDNVCKRIILKIIKYKLKL